MNPTGIVFIHGMWSQRGVWDRWLPAFAERGYVCDTVTLPGHHQGGDDAVKGVTFRDCVEAAREACARFVRPIVIGHSFGGLIAQKLASERELRAAVLLCSAAPRAVFPLRSSNLRGLRRHAVRANLWREELRLSRDEADYLLLGGLPDAERARLYADMVAESGRLCVEVGWGRFGGRHHDVDPRAIRCPMLSMAGTRDRMISIQVSRAIARYYGAVLDYREYDVAHWLLAETGYRERIADVLGWLEEEGAQAGVHATGVQA